MPTYEYECQKCHQHFEYFQSMSDAKKEKCEACGGPLERLISASSSFILKGGGWYKDLYSSSKPSETKSDSKSDKKKE